MKVQDSNKCTLSAVVMAMLAGCGGSHRLTGETGITVSSFPQMPISRAQWNAAITCDYKLSAGLLYGLYVALVTLKPPRPGERIQHERK